MSRFLAVSSAVLRKDCRELWPQAAPTAAVVAIAIAIAIANAPFGDTWLNLMRLASLFLVIILIVRLIQSDSPASARHDWLTRPIPGMALLAAKAAFMFLWITLPCFLGGTAQGLIIGHSLGEALLAGVQQSAPSAALLGIVVVGAITVTLWQAMLILAGTALFHVAARALITAQGQRAGWWDVTSLYSTGTTWVRDWAVIVLGIVAGALILWWQYERRKTAQARTAYAVVLALALLISVLMLSPSRTFAVQERLGFDRAAAEQVSVELMSGCFVSMIRNESANNARTRGLGGLAAVSDATMSAGGVDEVLFITTLMERALASDGHVLLGYPTAKYLDADGRTLFTVRRGGSPMQGTMNNGRNTLSHGWLLPRVRYEQLAAQPDVRLQIDYYLSLLLPKTEAMVPVDGRREFYPGLGYCSSRPRHASWFGTVDCFKAGPKPALLLLNRDGGSRGGTYVYTSGVPDFTPALLSWFAGLHYQTPMFTGSAPVRIAAYQAQAHFVRRFTAPGILGGPKEQCPAPGAGNRSIR